tara:strand:+ start:239 stop:1876 length:1638 start_codon:yes stop_codon:yes gene_type:complete
MKHRMQAVRPWLLGAVLLSSSDLAHSGEPIQPPDDHLDPGYAKEGLSVPRTAPDIENAVTSVAADANETIPIAGIQFKGAEVPARVAKATEVFLGQPANTETLKQLAAAMTAAYSKSDVALFTIAIPQQDLSDGVVDVFIAEGRVADIVAVRSGEQIVAPRLRGYLEPILDETPATRATYERGVSLARRAEGTKVTPRLQMAPEPGAINLLLDVEEKKNGFAVGYDSRESRIVDSGRISASAFGYSLLREGDVLRGRFAATPDGEQSQTASLQYATPIGTDGLKLDVAAVYQASHPSSVPIDGSATFFSAGLSYPLLLDFHREVALSAVLDHTESRNSALGSIIANERVDAARLGIRAGLIQENRSINGSLTYSRGLDLENAESAVMGAETGFNKISATAGVVQKLSKNLFLRLRASGQWSDDILPANERLMYGGTEYGRGFDNGVISFDKGYEAVLEPAWRPIPEGNFAKSELYLFADYGEGSLSLTPSISRDFNLGSAGIGARIGYKDYATIGLEYAEPWDVPVTGFSDDSVVTVSWAFKYQP